MEEKYLAFPLVLYEICSPRSVPVSTQLLILIGEDLDHFQVFFVHNQVFDGVLIRLEWRPAIDIENFCSNWLLSAKT